MMSDETKKRPTIAELEAILADTCPHKRVDFKPNGEVTTVDTFAELQAERDGLIKALEFAARWEGECGCCGLSIAGCDKDNPFEDGEEFPGCPGPRARRALDALAQGKRT